jgi:hypothetical protein
MEVLEASIGFCSTRCAIIFVVVTTANIGAILAKEKNYANRVMYIIFGQRNGPLCRIEGYIHIFSTL